MATVTINPSDQTITQYNVQTGGANNLLNNVSPSAISGIPIISQGSSSQPIFGTGVVAGGCTGQTTLTNHGILVGAGTSAITQLATGSTGQVLQSGGASADPTYSTATYPATAGTIGNVLTSDGTNWNSAAAFTPTPFVATDQSINGFYAVTTPYVGSTKPSFTETFVLQTGVAYYLPIFIDEAKTYTKIGVNVLNNPGAGSLIMMAIYDQGGSGRLPGNVLASAIGVNSAASGCLEGTISLALTAGWYWLAIQRNTTASVTVRSFGNAGFSSVLTNKLFIDITSLSSTDFFLLYTFDVTNVYGTFPTSPTPTAIDPVNGIPIVYLR